MFAIGPVVNLNFWGFNPQPLENPTISINNNEAIRYTGLTDSSFVIILKKRAKKAGVT